MSPEQLAQQLHSTLEDGLKTVVLYGSAAAGDFMPGTSHYNVLVAVERLGAGELERIAPVLIRWQQAGNDLPMLFTAAELATSADTFPIELADIHQSRRVLFGPDLLMDLTIDPLHLRLQIERELKGKLLALRRQYLAAGDHDDQLAALMTQSLSTFLVLMRAALRLFQVDPPPLKLDALEELSQRLPFDPQPFRHVHTLKMRGRPPSGHTLRRLFSEYLQAVECVVAAVDQHLHAPAKP